MEYFVLKNRVVHEPATAEAIFEKLQRGELLPTDLAQVEGTNFWTPLGVIFPPVTFGDHIQAFTNQVKAISLRWWAQPARAGVGCAIAATLLFLLSQFPVLLYGPFVLLAILFGAVLMLRGRIMPGVAIVAGAVLVPAFLGWAFVRSDHGRRVVRAEPELANTRFIESRPPAPVAQADSKPSKPEAPARPEGASDKTAKVGDTVVNHSKADLAMKADPLPEAHAFPNKSEPGGHLGQAPGPAEAAKPQAQPTAASAASMVLPDSVFPAAISQLPAPISPPAFAPATPAASSGGDSPEACVVVIETGYGKGSGFFTRMGDRTYLVTNYHVLQGFRHIQCSAADGRKLDVKAGTIEVAEDRDLVRIAVNTQALLKVAPNLPKIGEKVVAYGNSEGAGVITKLEGDIMGVGAKEVEVSTDFVPGNSGGPILNQNGDVVGVATYIMKSSSIPDWIKSGTRFNQPRRFAMRLAGDFRWQPMTLAEFQRQTLAIDEGAAQLIEFIGFTRELARNPFRHQIATEFGARRNDITGYVQFYNNLCTSSGSRSVSTTSGLNNKIDAARGSLLRLIQTSANSLRGKAQSIPSGYQKSQAAEVLSDLDDLATIVNPREEEANWNRLFGGA